MLEDLIRHGYEFIELRPKKSIPLKGWRESPSADPFKVLARGCNIGVRLRPLDLIIDVDPRNFPLGRRPDLELGLDKIDAPRVLSGGGGTHIYLRMAEAESIRGSLADYPGIDFKHYGGFVVAPGSIHRKTGRLYISEPMDWFANDPAPLVPESILSLIRSSSLVASGAGGEMVQWTPEQLAAVLGLIDVCDYATHDRWFGLMCAAHEVTAGLGMEEFVQWSAGNPQFASLSEEVRYRWRSLHTGKAGNAGAGTLLHVLIELGVEPPNFCSAASDFVDAPVGELSLMDQITREWHCVDVNGRMQIFHRLDDPTLNRYFWNRYLRRDFIETLSVIYKVPDIPVPAAKGKTLYVPAGKMWLDSYSTKPTYRGVVFDPRVTAGNDNAMFNLWRGFAYAPSPGAWGMLQELIWETLCCESDESFKYVMDWLAAAVQTPWEPGGTALVFKGVKGTGKSTLGRAFIKLFGQHGLPVSSPTLLTGRFNIHLRDLCALFADEAFWAGDKGGESVLKALITEPTIAYEGKGTNAEYGKNCLHIIMASNSDWVVPAGTDQERRYAVFETSPELHSHEWWARLIHQMDNGGYSAMLYDLLHRDLTRFNVFQVPQTKALMDQKIRGFSVPELWLFDLIQNDWGELNFVEPTIVLSEELEASMDTFYAKKRFYAGFMNTAMHMGRLVHRVFGAHIQKLRVIHNEKRRWAYRLPDIEIAKQCFRDVLKNDPWG